MFVLNVVPFPKQSFSVFQSHYAHCLSNGRLLVITWHSRERNSSAFSRNWCTSPFKINFLGRALTGSDSPAQTTSPFGPVPLQVETPWSRFPTAWPHDGDHARGLYAESGAPFVLTWKKLQLLKWRCGCVLTLFLVACKTRELQLPTGVCYRPQGPPVNAAPPPVCCHPLQYTQHRSDSCHFMPCMTA